MIRITKLNSGVEFQVVNKKGENPKKFLKIQLEELKRAQDWYYQKVIDVIKQLGLEGNGVTSYFVRAKFEDEAAKIPSKPGRVFWPLDIWGFATVQDNGKITMGNTGSTPTDTRAKILLACQTPLDCVEKGDYYIYSVTKEF